MIDFPCVCVVQSYNMGMHIFELIATLNDEIWYEVFGLWWKKCMDNKRRRFDGTHFKPQTTQAKCWKAATKDVLNSLLRKNLS